MAEPVSVMVVEDEKEIRELISIHLSRLGLKVKECSSSEEAHLAIKSQNYDLFVLDWMLPGQSGVEFAKTLRQNNSLARILMVTAKTDPQDIVEGLEKGADDYLSKPFDPSVLVARVKALLRRTAQLQSDVIEFEGLRINTNSFEVQLNGTALHLTPSEFKLLQTMMSNIGRVLTRDQLIEQIQGEGVNVIGRTIDTHVFGLRKKLTSWGERVETIRGVGYRVKADTQTT